MQYLQEMLNDYLIDQYGGQDYDFEIVGSTPTTRTSPIVNVRKWNRKKEPYNITISHLEIMLWFYDKWKNDSKDLREDIEYCEKCIDKVVHDVKHI